jgi:hypothetical protein
MRRLCAGLSMAIVAASLPAAVCRADDLSPSPASLAASAVFDQLYSRPKAEAAASKLAGQVAASWPASWTPLAADAIWEEDQAARPLLEARFAQIFQAHFTPGELRAGLGVLRAPVAEAPDQAAQMDPALVAKTEATPDGRSFLQKFNHVAPQLDDAAKSMMGERVPSLFRRLGEKAEPTVVTAAATEAEALQDEVACELLPADRARENMKPGLQKAVGSLLDDIHGHPEWQALLDKAVSDEVDASQSRFCLAMGRWLGQGLTEADSRAVLEFLKTPAGEAFRAYLAAATLHEPRPVVPPATEARIARFMATAAGVKLGANVEQGGKLGAEVGSAYGVSITPGVFRRFGEAVAVQP